MKESLTRKPARSWAGHVERTEGVRSTNGGAESGGWKEKRQAGSGGGE